MLILNNLSYSYVNNSQKQNFCFNLQVKKGEKLAIIGQSGLGKSTLLDIIAGFLEPESGEIYINQMLANNLKVFERDIAILFQDNNLFAHLTNFENITLSFSHNLKVNQEQKQAIFDLANKLQILDLLDKKPTEISGGQKQRVALCRVFLSNKQLLLLDEPFSALDDALRFELLEVLDDLIKQTHKTLIMVTHNLNDTSIANRTLHINEINKVYE